MTDYYEVLEPAEQTKVAGGSDGEQQCRLGSYKRLGEQTGSHSDKRNSQGGAVEEREKEIQAAGAAEAMMRWQNKPTCHGEQSYVPGRFGGDMGMIWRKCMDRLVRDQALDPSCSIQ